LKIPISKPYFDENEKDEIIKPLESGWVVQGKYVHEFESLFEKFTHTTYAHATTSCTTALHLSLVALGIGIGDKVLIPSFTYIATANAIEQIGAKVVFCDIGLKTFNIDEKKIENIVKNDSSIKAIIPVNLFGLCSNMPFIMNIANKYNLKVIEDSACGFDAWIENKHSGTFGDIGCFSFHPRKSITTGEGGMLITDNEELHTKVSQLKDHGASKSDIQRHKEGGSLLPEFNYAGFNYRLTDMQGALGVCQMNKATSIMSKKRAVAQKYDEALIDINYLQTPYTPDNYTHGYQSYVCIYANKQDLQDLTIEKIDKLNKRRNIFMEELEKKGIATRQGTHAVHTLAYYKKKYSLKDKDFLMSYAADRLSIALPLYPQMSEEEFNYIISQIKS